MLKSHKSAIYDAGISHFHFFQEKAPQSYIALINRILFCKNAHNPYLK